MEPDRQDSPIKEQQERLNSRLWELSSLGLEFTIILIIFFFAGKFIDDYWQLSPWGVLVGSISGFIISLYYLINRVNQSMK